uniref:Mab-21 domain-containing protein n=1 Tax=Strongyloides venezuelensis TaxID=75913 RepID=A0A0K0F7G7_STRVS
MNIEAFNTLTWKRFQKRDDYLRLMKNVETLLDNYRFNLAKIRVTTGYNSALENQKNMGDIELEPILYCSIDSDRVFSLENDVVKDKENDDGNGKSLPSKYLYKPFGMFENVYVKNARKSIEQVLPLFCELATIRKELLILDKEYFDAQDTLEFS